MTGLLEARPTLRAREVSLAGLRPERPWAAVAVGGVGWGGGRAGARGKHHWSNGVTGGAPQARLTTTTVPQALPPAGHTRDRQEARVTAPDTCSSAGPLRDQMPSRHPRPLGSLGRLVGLAPRGQGDHRPGRLSPLHH